MSELETTLMERLYKHLKTHCAKDETILEITLNYNYELMAGGSGEYKPVLCIKFNRKKEVGEEIFIQSDIKIKVKCSNEFDKLKVDVYRNSNSKIDAKCTEWHFSDPNFNANRFVDYINAIVK